MSPHNRLTLKPLVRETLHDRAYQQLKLALMAGAFTPGTQITLRDAAQRLGTSIMPVRDAVWRLVAERGLDMPKSRVVRVPVLTVAQFDTVLRMRVLLEREATRWAAERATAAELKEIERLGEQAERAWAAGPLERFFLANQTFHFAVYAAAHADLLYAMIEILWLQSGPYMSLVVDHVTRSGFRRSNALVEHERLLKALRTRNAAAAENAIEADLMRAATMYREQVALQEAAGDDARASPAARPAKRKAARPASRGTGLKPRR
jgi:DNA-binding GntR family transcriptional regulator